MTKKEKALAPMKELNIYRPLYQGICRKRQSMLL